LTILAAALLNAGLLCAQPVGAPAAPANLAVPLGKDAQIGISNISNANNASKDNNELSAAVTLGEGNFRLRLAGDVSKEQVHALAAVGVQFQNGYAMVGGSYARELMAEYDQKLSANSKFLEAGMANPVAGILRAFVKLNQKDAQDKHLDTRAATTQTVTVQDILTIFDTPTATTYRNTRKVTTTDTTTTTNTDFI
jgi:hypothetical protein